MRMRSEFQRGEPIARKTTTLHDVEAERALLGALLIDPRKVSDVEGRIGADSFYDPIHRQIFAAMLAIPDRTAIDPITIKGKLSEAGHLDAASAERLRVIEESALSAANVLHYVDIVVDKALRRRLAEVAESISGLSVEAGTDSAALCDQAEKLVFEVTDHGRKGEPRLIEEVLKETIALVQKMRNSKTTVTGMPTGIFQLDRRTTGFHPGELFILAARPGVGKTSLAMNMAVHAATRSDRAVAVFNLEMPAMQLALRMLCAEARISQGKLKSGRLSDHDMQQIIQHAAALWKAPIYVDDSSALTIMELRSKARRLKQQQPKLGFIVIDYLQLMSSRGKSESRQLEIAEISRGLKSLSKELSLPILALSQLSRDVEKNKRKPQLSDLRECVTGDTLVSLADGSRIPIADLVGQEPEVLAMSEDGRIVRARSDKVWKVGRRPIFSIRLASGRRIRATALHRLYGADGWRRVGELAVGDRLAIARSLPEPAATERWPDARVALLGDESLERAATSDLFWDRVVEIEPASEEEVYDLTVPGPSSWLADGIVSHNSGAIEQDADCVMFLHREPDAEPGGVGGPIPVELVIAKQRNGGIGSFDMVFMSEYTRFENAAEEGDPSTN